MIYSYSYSVSGVWSSHRIRNEARALVSIQVVRFQFNGQIWRVRARINRSMVTVTVKKNYGWDDFKQDYKSSCHLFFPNIKSSHFTPLITYYTILSKLLTVSYFLAQSSQQRKTELRLTFLFLFFPLIFHVFSVTRSSALLHRFRRLLGGSCQKSPQRYRNRHIREET